MEEEESGAGEEETRRAAAATAAGKKKRRTRRRKRGGISATARTRPTAGERRTTTSLTPPWPSRARSASRAPARSSAGRGQVREEKRETTFFCFFGGFFFFSRPEKNSLSSLSLSLFSVFLKQKTVGWIYNAGLAIRLKHYMWSHRAQIFSSRGGGGEQQQQGRRKVQENPGGGGEREENAAAAEEKAAAASDTTIDRRALATSYLVHHIDDAASARANGYADRRAYYADAATRKAIPHVTRTPLLFVSSADDPFLGELPLEEIEKNPRTALVVTERGGHCAFVDEGGLGESAWVDRLALEWLVRAVARRKGERGRTGVLSKL